MRDFLSTIVSSTTFVLVFAAVSAHASEASHLGTIMQQNEQLLPLSETSKTLCPGDIYQHYKGAQYKVLAVARHSESLEEMVVYEALYGEHDIWVRPLSMFLETVSLNGQTKPRFTKIS
jgi:hypothetical protein